MLPRRSHLIPTVNKHIYFQETQLNLKLKEEMTEPMGVEVATRLLRDPQTFRKLFNGRPFQSGSRGADFSYSRTLRACVAAQISPVKAAGVQRNSE